MQVAWPLCGAGGRGGPARRKVTFGLRMRVDHKVIFGSWNRYFVVRRASATVCLGYRHHGGVRRRQQVSKP